MKKRLTIRQLQVAVGGDPLNEWKALTLTISGIICNSEEVRSQFPVFFEKLGQLIQEAFPGFEPDSPAATLDIDDLEVEGDSPHPNPLPEGEGTRGDDDD